jgi:integrase
MTGIRKTKTGWQAYVWVADPTHPNGGYQASKRFPPSTTPSEMKAWRNKRKYGVVGSEQVVTFADDAAAYLQRDKVQRMPTAAERTRHITEWIARFGSMERKDIPPHVIQAALDAMRGTMSAGSVNKRRTALMDLWTVLDGRHQANPVKATRNYEEPHPEPRAPALATVLQVLNALPAKTDYGKKCRARLQVIAWTGWPHAIVKSLQETDRAHWQKGTAFIGRRKKGKGSRARWLPLLPQAKAALAEFHKADAYGHFSNSSLHKRVTATCKALNIPRVRPYDLRHFFLTTVAVITRDERAVMELGLISSPEIARRYTEAATDPRVQAAVRQVAGKLPRMLRSAAKLTPNSASALPRRKKPRKAA